MNTIFPPEDGHVNARNMSRIIINILLTNKENCALKLVDEIILIRLCVLIMAGTSNLVPENLIEVL